MSDIETVDVLISGAGPVGLYFAYRMASLGHTFYLCDKKATVTDETRALAITARTMELLEITDIAQHVMKEAFILHGAQMFVNGKKVGNVDSGGDTNYPHMTILAQRRTESILTRLLGADRIHRETELVQYEQNDSGVDAVVRDMKTGVEKRIRAQYIIGADGAHSTVRKLANDWLYEGYSMATRFVVGDVFLSGRDIDQILIQRNNIFSGTNGWAGLIPAGRRDGKPYYRMFASLGPFELDTDQDGDKNPTHGLAKNVSTTLEDAQKVLDQRLSPLQITMKDIDGFGVFKINERKANGFRRSRAFVIGDAAHCHSPLGGQGMNLGIQDAANLAWKLSLVLNGNASDIEKLLDSYSKEREPIVAATLKATGFATRYSLMQNPIISSIIGMVMSVALAFDTFKHKAIGPILQIQTQIPKESTILSKAAANTLIEPGVFMRETTVLRNRVINDDRPLERKTLHGIFQGHGAQHKIIWICTRPSRFEPTHWIEDFCNKLEKQRYASSAVQGMVVESAWHAHESKKPEFAGDNVAFWVEEDLDADKSLTKRVGLASHMYDTPEAPAAIVVVRPDLYVAYSGLIRSSNDIDHAFEFLNGYIRTVDN